MEQYIVTGMSCAACQARVEKAVGQVPGVCWREAHRRRKSSALWRRQDTAPA